MPDGPTLSADATLPGASTLVDTAALRARLVCLAVKLVWNRDDAEDIVQDAFGISLQRGLIGATSADHPQTTGPAGAEAWLWRTVCNLCLNHRRRRRLEPLDDLMAATGRLSPAANASRADELGRLRDAVALLPDQQRIAIVLRMMEELDYQRIAEIMELSEPAVRTHVHLARRALALRMAVDESGART